MSSVSDAERGGAVLRRVIPVEAPLHVEEVVAQDAGTGSGGPVFLLLHGYGSTSYVWRHWLPGLSARGRALLVDLKGFGSAPKPDDDRYSPVDFADAVVALIRELELRDLIVVGHSLGGGVSLLASDALTRGGEDRLRRLVLVAPAAYRQSLPPFVWFSHHPRLASALLDLVGTDRIMRWAMRSIVHESDAVTDDLVEEYGRAWKTPEGRRAAFAAGRQIVPTDLERRAARYGELEVPTLLLWGDDDRVVPLWVGERLQREMPQAELTVLDGCGHMIQDERPRASWRVVEDFLERTA